MLQLGRVDICRAGSYIDYGLRISFILRANRLVIPVSGDEPVCGVPDHTDPCLPAPTPTVWQVQEVDMSVSEGRPGQGTHPPTLLLGLLRGQVAGGRAGEAGLVELVLGKEQVQEGGESQ